MSQPIDKKFKAKIEQYFEYRWVYDKNMSFQSEEDLQIYQQLPNFVQENIYKDFLFPEFLKSFKRTFSFPNWDKPN